MKEYRKEENEKQVYSMEEVLQFTLNILGGIQIPAALSEQVGIPIAKAIGNLNAMIEATRNTKPENGKDYAKEEKKDGRAADAE